MFKKLSLFALLVVLKVSLFAQSAETGSPFNQYMSADAGVNLLSGTVSISKTLATISSGDVQASFAMGYSGNVTQYVNNRNDVAPTGWLGLGWSMGFAKIICEHNGSMSLDDDSYYLMTAEGNRHKIVKEVKSDKSVKWWISGLPYWKITQVVRKNVNYGQHQYDIIVGWIVTDDSGREYYYGDFEDLNNVQNQKFTRNATQFVLCWPDTYGMVGQAIGGTPRLFPNAWNLQQMKDLKGNSLSYYYRPYTEALRTGSNKSSAEYTKECYLQSVVSSEGEKVVFELKRKGEGVFADEFLDMTGDKELPEDGTADEFVDPIERFYLDKVSFYGKDGKLVRVAELCYEPLNFAPKTYFNMMISKVYKDSRYVKRLLKSVVFMDPEGHEVDRESYEYNTDDNASGPESNAPFGMMTAVQGFNCGRLEFEYTYLRTTPADKVSLHRQDVPMTRVSSIGYLEDGTPYIVGFAGKYVNIYMRSFGRWVFHKSFANDKDMEIDDEDNPKASFIIGDKGWFIYVKPSGNGGFYNPVVWNGREFVKQGLFKDNSSRDNIAVGAGFIFKARIEEDGARSHITLTIPWSIWGKTYGLNDKDAVSNFDFVGKDGSKENHFAAEDGSMDRLAIKVYASTNHVGIFYLGTDGGNNGRLRLYTFNHDKSKLVLTYSDRDLDDDNVYVLNGDILYGATEDSGPYGHNADVFQWTESSNGSWDRYHWDLHGVQGVPSIEAYGPDYFVVKHNDGDDMSVLYWNGKTWSTPYKNRNMVSGDDFDFFYESEWNGYSGNGFFIAREPLIEPKTISIPYWVPKRWGLRKRHKKIQVWSSTYRGALLDRYDIRDGKWSNTGAQNLDNSTSKTHLMVGTDWFIEKTSKRVFTWDGVKWNVENLDIDYGDDYRSLGGNSFVIEHENDNKSTIYFKKSDSFASDYGFYLVTGKVLKDPVLDKVVRYTYMYNSSLYGDYSIDFLNGVNSSTDVTFDFVNNTPIISKYKVFLPNNLGYEEKTLCSLNYLTINEVGLGAGQLCQEATMNSAGLVTSAKTTVYERYDGSVSQSWPKSIYQDRIAKVTTENNRSRSEVRYSYSDVNGQISSVKTYLDGKSVAESEKRVEYAAEVYSEMKNVNRLLEEYSTRDCHGECSADGKNVVSANVSRYKKAGSNQNYYVVSDVWSYRRQDGKSSYSFDKDNPPVNNPYWEKNTEYTKYENYKAVESVDKLGIKSSAYYEDGLNGSLQGSVVNAGYDESFIFLGTAASITQEKLEHSVQFHNNSYYIVPLVCGTATDWYRRNDPDKEFGEQCLSMGKDDAVNYGRFAANAVLVNSGKNLRGQVFPAKRKKYVFSAWVQGVNAASGKATLYVADNYSTPAKEWTLKGAGVWQPIEWEDFLDGGREQRFELKVDNGNNMRVQSVLLVPSEASATITYWNWQWNKPIASVNDRGIGTYSVLDDAGRVVQTYGENNDGDLVKLSESEYRGSDCRAVPAGLGTLSQLKINGDNVLGIGDGLSLSYVVPNSTEELHVTWKTTQKDERVRYAFVKKGEDVTEWKTSCCNILVDAILNLPGSENNWQLLIDVYPFDDSDNSRYTIDISRSMSGWVDYGSPLNFPVGSSPKYASSVDPSRLYYLNDVGVGAASFNGSSWTIKNEALNVRQNLLQVGSSGTTSYVLTLPEVAQESWMENDANGNKTVKKYANTSAMVYKASHPFSSQGNIGIPGEQTELYRIALDKNSVPYVLYMDRKNVFDNVESVELEDENGRKIKKLRNVGQTESHLYVKKYDSGSNSWGYVGNTLSLDTDQQKAVLVDNVVSDGDALDADIVFSGDVPYVAYIGRVDDMKYMESVSESFVDADGTVSEKTGENTIMPRFVIVKRLYSAGAVDPSISKPVWAGPSKVQDIGSNLMLPQTHGDIVELLSNGEYVPITSAKRLKLAVGAKGLYLAVLYQLNSDIGTNLPQNRYALTVFKAVNKSEVLNDFEDDPSLSLNVDALRFEPLLDNSVTASLNATSPEEENRVVAYLDDTDPFDIAVYTDKQGNEFPYLMFANESNVNQLTVVKYEGSRWLSVGRPAFVTPRNDVESADLTVYSTGTTDVPYVAFREDASTINTRRHNKVITQKYNATGDKDLSLLSLGFVPGTTISSSFRQYILNYAAFVPESQSVITVTPSLRSPNDVCSVVIENNEKEVNYWRSNSTGCKEKGLLPSLFNISSNSVSSMSIPLNPGQNEIKIKVYASNGEFLAYTISVYREFSAEDGLEVTSLDGGLRKTDEKVDRASDGTEEKKITYVSDGETGERTVCLQFNGFWTMEYNGRKYYMGSCIEIDFPNGCSESGNQYIRLVDNKGNTRILTIKDGSCKKNEKNEYLSLRSSSSVNPGSSGSINPRSSGSVNPGSSGSINPRSSGSVNPGSSGSVNPRSSGSVNPGSSGSVNPRSSGSVNPGSSGSVNPGSSGSVNPRSSGSVNPGSSGSVNPRSSGSVNPGSSGSVNPRSSGSVNPGSSGSVNPRSSGSVNPGSSGSVNPRSSGSVNPGSSGSVNPRSSGSIYSSSSVNTAIPSEYSTLIGYKVFTTGNLNIADRVVLEGGILGCASANVGVDARISVTLYASGDVSLRNNSYTERVISSGRIDTQSGAQFGTMQTESFSAPAVATHDVQPGNEDLYVYYGQSMTINPGSYRNIHIFAGANVTVNGGEYNLESFRIEADAHVTFRNSSTPVRLWIRDAFSLGDRVKVNSDGSADNLFVYTNASYLNLGVGSSMKASIVAPNAYANIASGYVYDGRIWAKEINIQPEATVR